MKTTFSLSLSVAKRNKGFTLGLVILFMILSSIIVMERYTTPSVLATIRDYSEQYCVPDLWAVTEPLPLGAQELLPQAPEIIGRECSMVLSARCRVRQK